MISGNMVGSYSQMGKTLILLDENGNEITGVIVDQETVFTAGDNDVREGFVYAGDDGVSTGTKNIPAYRTQRGVYMVFDGDDFIIDSLHDYSQYDYTELQCIIAPLGESASSSVAADKIVLNNSVYRTESDVALSNVFKDNNNKAINLNISNNSGLDYVIHYFTYRKED